MNLKRIMVTGASGPLGVMLIRECIDRGIRVLAFVRPRSKKIIDIPTHELVRVVEWELNDMDKFQPRNCESLDACFHFGWGHTGDPGRDDPVLQEQNSSATLKTAFLAKRLGCKVFVGAGSQAEYGMIDHRIDENTPANPVTMYGIAKLAAGKLVMEYCRQNDMLCYWIRIFSVYGPYENQYIFISYVIRTLLNHEKPVLTRCEQIWDFLYCKDAINAFLAVAERGRHTGVYCLGSGDAKRLSEYVEMIRDAIDPSLSIGIGEKSYSSGQIMHLEADISKLKGEIGFSPRYSFADGIRETIKWYRDTEK